MPVLAPVLPAAVDCTLAVTNPHVMMFTGAPSATNPHMAFAKRVVTESVPPAQTMPTAGEPSSAYATVPPSAPAPAPIFLCSDCKVVFASRNLLFKHLKNPAVACGAADQKVEKMKTGREAIARAAHAALTPEDKELLREKNRLKQARAEARKLNEMPLPQTAEELAKELWVGGLVTSVASIKGLKNVLWLAAGDTSRHISPYLATSRHATPRLATPHHIPTFHALC